MKINGRYIVILSIILLILIVSFILIYYNNIKYRYGDYKLELTVITNGTDEYGNNLKGFKKTYEYNVKNNLVFYETNFNKWTTAKDKNNIGKILKIKKINKDNVIVETSSEEMVIKYNEEKSINSLMFVSDGLNCVYYYRIVRKK